MLDVFSFLNYISHTKCGYIRSVGISNINEVKIKYYFISFFVYNITFYSLIL